MELTTRNPYWLVKNGDSRMMTGGRDDNVTDARRRRKRLSRKATLLAEDFHKLMPDLPFRTDFSWAGTFGSTRDGLPYIGSIREMPHIYFTLGCGSNGITFGLLTGEIIVAALQNKRHPLTEVFAFER